MRRLHLTEPSGALTYSVTAWAYGRTEAHHAGSMSFEEFVRKRKQGSEARHAPSFTDCKLSSDCGLSLRAPKAHRLGCHTVYFSLWPGESSDSSQCYFVSSHSSAVR